jgi:hypothetical protein
MENQDDIDYVDLLHICGNVRKVKLQNQPTAQANKSCGLYDKITLRKNV